MNRFYHTSENKIILTGDTFTIKEQIKKAGGKWDAAQKNWWLIQSEVSASLIKELGFSLLINSNDRNSHLPEKNEDQQKNSEKLNVENLPDNKAMSVTHFVLLIEAIIRKNLSEKYWICGEISSFKSTNGHVFFDLIDKSAGNEFSSLSLRAASISCILWANKKTQLNEKISKILFQDGTRIKVLVTCDFRKEGSKINAIIDDIDIQFTQGELALQRIQIIQELKKRNLYHKNKQLKLKEFPLKIALITAENSRACADFYDELRISHISFQITLFDCNMQGEKTSENVAHALKYITLNSHLYDCIVITRGGGSRLDLRWFDDLNIATQIALSPLPIITAVGHFDDTSIADEVAYHCEKTPTAAARFLTENILFHLNTFFSRLEKMTSLLLKRTSKEKQLLVSLEQRLCHAARKRIESEKKQIKGISQVLKAFQSSISQTLLRGYALVYDDNGTLITGKDFLKNPPPHSLKLKFANDCENQHIFVDVSVNGINLKNDQPS
ncbi:exodeoxyribonuclease VII large subunit [Silvanigrella aquatica]|uniref:Exodeoxyribonuclease 7 large subunit n=1 Tax=Silvanigrella aquatica TaxID=1915309 RepID=A0A1L4D1S8_9BACT|nr:exodeoxyribonuclease VII large subunit [Silvanigrella aquatica]APJ04165.1 exodeoxyribonuclease VII large subunit [Silvanigrella aquatica]